jgi:hypothetical protein
MISRLLIVAALASLPVLSSAQVVPTRSDDGAAHSEASIPGIAAADIPALLDGRDAGLARVAESAGLPDPAEAIAASATLGLSAEQLETIRSIDSIAVDDARRLGRALIEQEARLDSIFAAGDPRDWNVRPVVLEVGRLSTELRYVHLRAHMRVWEILSDEQKGILRRAERPAER